MTTVSVLSLEKNGIMVFDILNFPHIEMYSYFRPTPSAIIP